MNVKYYRFWVLGTDTIETTTNRHIVSDRWFKIMYKIMFQLKLIDDVKTNIIPVNSEGAGVE